MTDETPLKDLRALEGLPVGATATIGVSAPSRPLYVVDQFGIIGVGSSTEIACMRHDFSIASQIVEVVETSADGAKVKIRGFDVMPIWVEEVRLRASDEIALNLAISLVKNAIQRSSTTQDQFVERLNKELAAVTTNGGAGV
jgi:hypothetical protein